MTVDEIASNRSVARVRYPAHSGTCGNGLIKEWKDACPITRSALLIGQDGTADAVTLIRHATVAVDYFDGIWVIVVRIGQQYIVLGEVNV